MRRILLGLITMAVASLVVASTAAAGGSWFRPTETDIQPGDSVTMVGFSGFGPDEGNVGDPFYGYLEIDPSQSLAEYPQVHPGMLPVGQITVTRTGEAGYAAYRLHLRFTVPSDLTPGLYNFMYCNDPCTDTFGELISGSPLAIGEFTRESAAEALGIEESELIEEGWSGSGIDPVDITNPLVADLVGQDQLALTGPARNDLAWLAIVFVGVGVAAIAAARRLT